VNEVVFQAKIYNTDQKYSMEQK